jgi:hypothetical protein
MVTEGAIRFNRAQAALADVRDLGCGRDVVQS